MYPACHWSVPISNESTNSTGGTTDSHIQSYGNKRKKNNFILYWNQFVQKYYGSPRAHCTMLWARQSHCFTNISIQTVSGFRLPLHSDIVSHPPEKICSTATADPVKCGKIMEVTPGTPDVKSGPMRCWRELWLQLMCCAPFRLLSQDFGMRMMEYWRSEYWSKG